MSQEKVETVHRWFEALSDEDFDAALALVHPEIEFVPPGGQAPYRGAESLRRWMEPDAFRRQVVEPLESVVVADRTSSRDNTSRPRGPAAGSSWISCPGPSGPFDDDGLVTRVEVYLDHEQDKARVEPVSD